MFVDETGASTKMTGLYGRCPRGERLVALVPWGHWKTTTFIGALRQDGLVAPCAFDGPIKGEKFRAWVEQFLVPELKPGDIVILTICRARLAPTCASISGMTVSSVWPSLGSSPRAGSRIAGQRLHMGDELAALGAGERGGDRHLDAELTWAFLRQACFNVA